MTNAIEIVSKLGKKIYATEQQWFLISNYKHPVMKGKEKEVEETLKAPDEIRISKSSPNVFLYHKLYGKEYASVIVRHLNGEGEILTAYKTRVIKEGKIIYIK